MKIGENKEIDVEAYYARYNKRRGQASKKKLLLYIIPKGGKR